MNDWVNQVHTGDCLEVLGDLPDESIHAGVTDPPYGLAFMGRDWDDFEPREYQEWCEQWAREVKRVLKPGGHLLAFSGNRTHHRLFTGVEDAGFEIRDTITWHYGSGFPKASDISKTIQKREGVEPAEVKDAEGVGFMNDDDDGWNDTKNQIEMPDPEGRAKKWDGWKTGLKPATEYVVMARKPFDGATVDCVLDHGTGALNIDGCRIESGERPNRELAKDHEERGGMFRANDNTSTLAGGAEADGTTTEGRYPSNVVFDGWMAQRLDNEVGDVDSCDPQTLSDNNNRGVYNGGYSGGEREVGYDDAGGPSRYFYTSKASRSERTEGGTIENDHPTVKPVDLMEWLVKLVTRRDQIVLDPFAGSGTTLKAAKKNTRKFIGIEQQAKWADLARGRVGIDMNEPGRFTDDGQAAVSEWV